MAGKLEAFANKHGVKYFLFQLHRSAGRTALEAGPGLGGGGDGAGRRGVRGIRNVART